LLSDAGEGANGDYLLPTVSTRCSPTNPAHQATGRDAAHGALDESNHQLLERDLRYAW